MMNMAYKGEAEGEAARRQYLGNDRGNDSGQLNSWQCTSASHRKAWARWYVWCKATISTLHGYRHTCTVDAVEERTQERQERCTPPTTDPPISRRRTQNPNLDLSLVHQPKPRPGAYNRRIYKSCPKRNFG